jgi:hypothetical protein
MLKIVLNYYPGDLKKIFEVFPMAEIIIFEHERKKIQSI